MATFIVEDGSGLTTANSLASVAELDAYAADYPVPSSFATAAQAAKEKGLRVASQYMDIKYAWKGIKTKRDQGCCWPRFNSDDGTYGMDSNVIPFKVKQACCYLATRVIEGDDLLALLEAEGEIKSHSESVGPISESTTYVGSESPNTEYQVADGLVKDYLIAGHGVTIELKRG